MPQRNFETLIGLAIRLRAEAADLCALASELVDEADQLTELAANVRPEVGRIPLGPSPGAVRIH